MVGLITDMERQPFGLHGLLTWIHSIYFLVTLETMAYSSSANFMQEAEL
jgi:hypothetical protein